MTEYHTYTLRSKLHALKSNLVRDAAAFAQVMERPAPSRARSTQVLDDLELLELHRPRARARRRGRERSRRTSSWNWDEAWPTNMRAAEVVAMRDWWVRFIKGNGPWEWFVTLTFTDDISEKEARRLTRRWLARVRQGARTRAGRTVPFGWVMAVEYTTNARVHLHLLVKADGALTGLPRYRWQQRWESVGDKCGMARVDPARGRASPYLTKYIGKGGRLDCGGKLRGGWLESPGSNRNLGAQRGHAG